MYQSSARAPRLLFLGMLNELSLSTLKVLLEAEAEFCGIIVPASELEQAEVSAPVLRLQPDMRRSELPIVAPYVAPNLIHLAWKAEIPVYAVSQIADPAVENVVLALNPDLACVACFPQRLPLSILNLPPLGFLNLHPSLLPAFRGPAPMFWIWRTGQMKAAGITIHFMTEEVDAGDILLQAPISYPDGISGPEADRLAGQIGGKLLRLSLRSLVEGRLERQPQAGDGSYYPWPGEPDFELNTDWSAQRAFNFMRGTAEWGFPYPISVEGSRIKLAEAVNFVEEGNLESPIMRTANIARLQFHQGILEARLQ